MHGSGFGHGFGLSGLSLLSDAETRSISAENPTGERGGGAKRVPEKWDAAFPLGRGWKASPAIGLEPGVETVLADIKGPGVIQHLWITSEAITYRNTVLRFYWDDEETPSVELPLGDFFCNGHGLRYKVVSIPVAVLPDGGFNCYWPMPFTSRARVTIESLLPAKQWGFFYQLTYSLTDVPAEAARFHAQYRRSVTNIDAPDHIILDGVRGQGHYVGTHLAWTQHSEGWWGEGEVKFYLDGDREFPTLCGTGLEDYVGGAWGFADETYSAPFAGYPLHRVGAGEAPLHGLYRWHVLDPIRFKEELRVTVQAIGMAPGSDKYRFLSDDVASVAYWYQREPHGAFPALDLGDRS